MTARAVEKASSGVLDFVAVSKRMNVQAPEQCTQGVTP